jgi:hypothetical protein
VITTRVARLCLLAMLACIVANGAWAADVATPPTLEGRALVDALRGGGYVLYLRHTSTDFGENDAAMTTFDDCSKQRNLTDAGRAEARAIGAALRTLQIPIGTVLASPYCRTLETGRLVFGHATPSNGMRGGPAQPESPERYAELRAALSTPFNERTNKAISSHGNPFHGVAGPPYLTEGEIAVVQPKGAGKFTIVARVPVRGFPALAAALATPRN